MTVVTLDEFHVERTDHCANTVREWIRIGRCLRGLRASAEAFEKGDLSYSKVRALTRFATPENESVPIPTAPYAVRSAWRRWPGAS